jgi:AraC-like DNA-binding protein
MDLVLRETATSRFSTDAFPERDRMAALREEFGQKFLRLDVEPNQDSPVRARFLFHALPGLVVAKSDHSPVVTRRTPAMLGHGEEDFVFAINVVGPMNVVQRKRELVCRPGDAFLFSSAEPGSSSRSTPGRHVSLRMPRAVLADLVPRLDDATLRPISRDIEALRLLRAYLEVLDDTHALKTPELRRAVVAHYRDLVALAITGKPEMGGGERSGLRAARLCAMKSDVVARLSETHLSPKSVARAHGVSDRYVHLLFAETGQTFSGFVEEERMKRAFELLTDPARSDRRIGDIAAAVGFAELSTFDRVFRRRFGDSPSGVRRRR